MSDVELPKFLAMPILTGITADLEHTETAIL